LFEEEWMRGSEDMACERIDRMIMWAGWAGQV